jgi:HK97 family phage prohead protease
MPFGEIDDERSVELRAPSLVAPSFMATSAKRGLRLHEEGESGDGLRPATVADARRMANGEPLSEGKWRRIAPWIARHIVDLDAVQGDEITPGLVAMLLWGGGASKSSARRAQAYAERIVQQLDERGTMLDVSNANWVSVHNEQRSVAYVTNAVEVRAEGDVPKLVGYAAVFDSPSEPLPFTEYVRRGAFEQTLEAGADVRLLIDHDGLPLARTTSGTLRLAEDDLGLLVEAELDAANPDAQRVISGLRRGDLSQMSFAFRTLEDRWSADKRERELLGVELFDVSVVTYPAYESTVAELRKRETVANLKQATSLLLRKQQLAIAKVTSRK